MVLRTVLTTVSLIACQVLVPSASAAPIHDAVKDRDRAEVERLIDEGADVNALDEEGNGPLILAAEASDTETVLILVEAGANVNSRDASGLTVLMRAISTDSIGLGYIQTVSVLLDAGADVHAQDENGFTSLIHAAVGHTGWGTLVIGGVLTIVGPPGGRAALESVYLQVVDALLARGADVNQRTAFGGTALMAAASAGYTTVTNSLLRAGADVNATDNRGITALMIAAHEGHVDTIEVLLDSNVNVDASDWRGATALDAAGAAGHREVVRLLRDAGAVGAVPQSVALCEEVVQTQNGETAPPQSPALATSEELNSVVAGDLERLQVLLTDPNVAERDTHRSLLMYAAGNGHFEVAKFLIERGADIHHTDSDGADALMWASSTRLAFPDSGKALTPGFRKIVECLLNAGANPNATSNNGLSSLLFAGLSGHTDIMGLLLDGGAELNGASADGRWTALMFAANEGHIGTVDFLLDSGADTERRDEDGSTAIMLASVEGHVEIVRSLLQAGADVDAKIDIGMTPLMAATFWGNREIVEILLQSGADYTLTANNGLTVLQIAEMQGHQSIVEMLRRAGAVE